VHILTLQPDEFAATVTVADESMQTDNGTLRNTKAAREWLAGLSADVTPITPGELATVEAMANAVVGHTACAKILADAPQREVTALWYEYTMSGKAVACKARADMLGASVIADLKTTAQIGGFSLRGIATAIARYNYHGQFGWYSRGFAKAGGQSGAGDVMRETWAWAFVDKNAPHDVVAAYADEAMIDEGIATALDAWDAYAKAIDCGEWPGIAPEAVTVSLPNWAFRNESTEDMGLEGLS
jgi:hypothetical protein